MKLLFFLIAFGLVFLRAYILWANHHGRKGDAGDILIKSDNFYELMKWSGKIKIKEEDSTLISISPGGYFKYKRNEENLIARSNVQGEISYELYNGPKQLTMMDTAGKALIKEAVGELIGYGYDGKERMERIYRQGGNLALLKEMGHMRTDVLKSMYLNKLLGGDSLSESDLPEIMKQIGSFGSDYDKQNFLSKLSWKQLSDSAIFRDYLAIVEKIGADNDKRNLLSHLLEKEAVNGSRIDSVLEPASSLGADLDKIAIYEKLTDLKDLTEAQWITLLGKVGKLSADMDKANMLIRIAAKMPKTDDTRAAYKKVAESLNNDADYGRVIRLLN